MKTIFFFLSSIFYLLSSGHVSAQVDIGKSFFGENSTNPIAKQGVQGVGPVVSAVISNLYVLAGLVLLFMLMWGGFAFLSGAGSDEREKVAKGRKILMSAIIGFLIIVASYFIIVAIGVMTGFKII